jgi:hypothetical protein
MALTQRTEASAMRSIRNITHLLTSVPWAVTCQAFRTIVVDQLEWAEHASQIALSPRSHCNEIIASHWMTGAIRRSDLCKSVAGRVSVQSCTKSPTFAVFEIKYYYRLTA